MGVMSVSTTAARNVAEYPLPTKSIETTGTTIILKRIRTPWTRRRDELKALKQVLSLTVNIKYGILSPDVQNFNIRYTEAASCLWRRSRLLLTLEISVGKARCGAHRNRLFTGPTL